MKESLKVFLACFIGGIIGTVVALQLHFFWWLGLIVGFVAGYLSYEFKAVINAALRTWRIVNRLTLSKLAGPWRFLRVVLLSFISAFSWTVLITVAIIIRWSDWSKVAEGTSKEWFPMVVAYATLFFMLLALQALEQSYGGNANEVLWKLNPIYVGFYWLPKGIIYIIPRTPRFFRKAIITIGRFTKILFILIHSDIRLLCGTDAAIGVVIGYFTGNVLIGGLAGGVFGVLNYEILSKRILHLVHDKT